MTKAERFLWIVQTTTLANVINLASDPELAGKYRVEKSAAGALILADEAVRASELIPEDMTAFEAANQFCYFMLQNLRDAEEKAAKEKMLVPEWFARY